MKTRAFVWLAVASCTGIAAVLGGCPSFAPDVGPFADGSDGASSDGAPTCDPSKDPSCVNDSSGIFVSPSGSDSNAGTKASPMQTIGAALTKASGSKSAVYICAGTYAEHVKVSSAVSLFGGFACPDWSYSGIVPKVAPNDVGFALDVEGVTSAIAIQDLDFDAVDGMNPGDSSIAVFVASSSNVTLRRVKATAGSGMAGADPIAVDSDAGIAPAGSMTTTDMGAGPCANTCGAETSLGGSGGVGAVSPGLPTDGADGGPSIPENPALHNGNGGIQTGGVCAAGRPGADSFAADAGASGASTSGHLTMTGWSTAVGKDGATGSIAQGGGGGSGGQHPTATNNGGGGGGGCGGCGGAGGAGGKSGGSSFAVLVYQSTTTLDTCALTVAKGGDGKPGGSGQLGQTGGDPGSAATFGCPGGAGGKGGAGAGGGGGAGGDAIAIGYVGTKPATSSTTFAEGNAGTGGVGGAGSSGNDGARGADGTKGDVVELP